MASFSSGSESDPPVAFIQLGLLCPGMPLPLSFSHTPTEAGKWGAGVNLGQIPRENATQKFPTPLKKKHNALKKTQAALCSPSTTNGIHGQKQTRTI